jgi:hypothetical protein
MGADHSSDVRDGMLQHKGQDNIPPRNTLPFAQPASPPRCDGDDLPACAIGNDFRKSQHAALEAPFRAAHGPFRRTPDGMDRRDGHPAPSAEAADAYAKRQGLNFIVQGPAEATQDCCPMTPWILGFASDHVAAPNAWVSGIVIGAVATAALTKLAEWEVWINFLLGVWVLVSPWVLSFLARRGAKAVIPIASDHGG